LPNASSHSQGQMTGERGKIGKNSKRPGTSGGSSSEWCRTEARKTRGGISKKEERTLSPPQAAGGGDNETGGKQKARARSKEEDESEPDRAKKCNEGSRISYGGSENRSSLEASVWQVASEGEEDAQGITRCERKDRRCRKANRECTGGAK